MVEEMDLIIFENDLKVNCFCALNWLYSCAAQNSKIKWVDFSLIAPTCKSLHDIKCVHNVLYPAVAFCPCCVQCIVSYRWRPSTAYLPCSTCRGKCCVTTSRMLPTMTRSHLYRRVGSMESGGSLDIPMVSTGTLSGNLETDSTMNGNSFLPRKLARDGKIWTYSSRERNSFWWTTPNQLRNNVDSS